MLKMSNSAQGEAREQGPAHLQRGAQLGADMLQLPDVAALLSQPRIHLQYALSAQGSGASLIWCARSSKRLNPANHSNARL